MVAKAQARRADAREKMIQLSEEKLEKGGS
jgi:hypothetical protein